MINLTSAKSYGLATSHATSGGINEQFLKHFVERGLLTSVSDRLDPVLRRLDGKSPQSSPCLSRIFPLLLMRFLTNRIHKLGHHLRMDITAGQNRRKALARKFMTTDCG